MSTPGKRKDKTEHRYVEDRLSSYIDGQLSSKERRVVEDHLTRCRHCQWNLDTLQQTVQWTRELTPVPVPRVFTIPIPAQPAPAPRWRWSVPLLQGATAVVALLLFFVVAGDMMLTAVRPGIMPAMAPPAEVAVERAPAAAQATEVVEQVEKEVLEPVLESEEAMPADSLAPTAESLPAAEPMQALEMEGAVADSTLGADEMGMAASEPEEIAVEEAAREEPAGEIAAEAADREKAAEEFALEAAVAEKAAAAPPPPAATGPVETKTVWVEPTPTSPPTATSLPTQAPPTAAPTVVAEAPAQPLRLTGEQHAEPTERSSQPVGSWLGLAEIVLGIALVVLATTTVVAMIRRRRAG